MRPRVTTFLAIALYGLLVPVGLLVRVVADPLRERQRPGAAGWRPVRTPPPSLARARRLD